MASEVGIYNMALARIGVDKTVASTSESSKEARLCSRFYAQCRDEVLEAGAWPFAVKTVALALLADDGKLPGWGYQYERPADALRILELATEDEVTTSTAYWTTGSAPWEGNQRAGALSFRQALSNTGNGVVLLSNIETPYVVYVARITNPEIFSPLMTSCVADRLAMELAMPMSADPRWFQVAMTRYNQSFMLAASAHYEQEDKGPEYDPPAIRARA